MKKLRSSDLVGNWATLLLPINKDDTINLTKLSDEIDVLVESNPNGIYSNGTAGEFYSLNEKEFDQVNHLLAEKCKKAKIPFQIGISHPSAQISLSRLERVEKLQPSAVQFILPDWFPVTLEEAVDFIDGLANVGEEVRLVMYNPPHAKKVLAPHEWRVIKEAVPNLIGVKVSDKDADKRWYKKARENSKNLAIFVPGHNLATGVAEGMDGAYSNVACLSPLGAQRWYNLMKSDLDEALEVEERIHTFFKEYITPFITQDHYSNQAVDKLLATVGNWTNISPRLRWPYRSLSAETAVDLRPIAKKHLPEFFFS